MIDIHCHILPEVDDGPTSVEEALKMARIAAEDGIHTIVSTSHFLEESGYISGDQLKNHVEKFNGILKEEEISITVLLGNEAYISPLLPQQVENNEVFTINNSRYLLVELPFNDIPIYTEETLYQLKLKGITPIIAHPERYRKVIEQPNMVHDWIHKGALIQINAGSLTGKFGLHVKEVSEILLRHNMVHFIGSDGHSAGGRKPLLGKAVLAATDIIGKEQALKLVNDNVLNVVNNEEIIINEPVKFCRRRRKTFFNTFKSLIFSADNR